MDDNSGVTLPPELGRPSSVKTAHVGVRIDVFEEFAVDYNLSGHILI